MSYLADKSLSIKLFTYWLNDMYLVFPNSSSFASLGNSIRTFICFVSTSFIGRPRPCFSIHAKIVKYYQLLQCEIIYYYLVFLICINDLLYYLYIIKQQLKNKIMTTNQANQILSTVKRTDISRTQIKEELIKMNIIVTGSFYKNLDKFEQSEIYIAIGFYYRWVASGMFKNRVIYSPANTAQLIDAYNKSHN